MICRGPSDITVIPIVSDHLLPSVRNVGTHGGEPFRSLPLTSYGGIEHFFVGSVFRSVNSL